MILCGRIESGSVAEWLKAHDSKSCGQQCLGGSNPLASAIFKFIIAREGYFFDLLFTALASEDCGKCF